MGVTRDVKDWFINRINKVLDEKLESIMEKVDNTAIDTEIIKRFGEKCNDKTLYARWLISEAQESKWRSDRNDLEKETRAVMDNIDGEVHHYYGYSASGVKDVAKSIFKKEVLKDIYPNVVPQIEQIEKIKEDVTGVVLLASSEPKLVDTLTKVLQKYGGEITELLDLIPKND